jgi:hypothetical protein
MWEPYSFAEAINDEWRCAVGLGASVAAAACVLRMWPKQWRRFGAEVIAWVAICVAGTLAIAVVGSLAAAVVTVCGESVSVWLGWSPQDMAWGIVILVLAPLGTAAAVALALPRCKYVWVLALAAPVLAFAGFVAFARFLAPGF